MKLAESQDERDFQGIPIVVEWPKGSTRTGTGKDGKEWHRKMHADYGYIPDTSSKGDGEDVDVYLGPDAEAEDAFVIEQLKDDHSFDEVKIMLGYPDPDTAQTAYLQHYPDGWESHIGDIWALPVGRLRELVKLDQAKEEEREAAA